MLHLPGLPCYAIHMNNEATATQTADTYRLTYTHSGGFYRLRIVGDNAGKVAGVRYANRPTFATLRAFLAANHFEAYGDMRRLSDGSHVSMVRRVA